MLTNYNMQSFPLQESILDGMASPVFCCLLFLSLGFHSILAQMSNQNGRPPICFLSPCPNNNLNCFVSLTTLFMCTKKDARTRRLALAYISYLKTPDPQQLLQSQYKHHRKIRRSNHHSLHKSTINTLRPNHIFNAFRAKLSHFSHSRRCHAPRHLLHHGATGVPSFKGCATVDFSNNTYQGICTLREIGIILEDGACSVSHIEKV